MPLNFEKEKEGKLRVGRKQKKKEVHVADGRLLLFGGNVGKKRGKKGPTCTGKRTRCVQAPLYPIAKEERRGEVKPRGYRGKGNGRKFLQIEKKGEGQENKEAFLERKRGCCLRPKKKKKKGGESHIFRRKKRKKLATIHCPKGSVIYPLQRGGGEKKGKSRQCFGSCGLSG